MKAKVFVLGTLIEAILETDNENGNLKFESSTDSQTVEEFKQDVASYAKENFDSDVSFEVATLASYKKQGTQQLQKTFRSTTGLEHEIVKSILVSRGVLQADDEEDAVSENNEEAVEDSKELSKADKKAQREAAKAEAEKLKTKQLEEKEAAKAAKAAEREAAKAAKREAREAAALERKKPRPTRDEILDIANEMRQHVGKVIRFKPFAGTGVPEMEGVIKQVTVDTRVNRSYFRIDGNDGKQYHTQVTNKNYVIDEEKSLALIKAQEEQKAAKLKALEEQKAAKEAEKAAKIAAKMEEKAAKKAAEKAAKAEATKEESQVVVADVENLGDTI